MLTRTGQAGAEARPERLLGEGGAGLVEYVLLLSLIALVCMGALSYFGSESGNSLTTSSSRIVEATK